MSQLDPNSTDVVLPGLLHHYENRPPELEHLCLAKFTAWYNYYGKKPGKNQKEGHESDGEDCTEEVEKSPEKDTVLELQNGSGFIRERTKSKIIRYRKYNILTDPTNYYR